MPILQKHGIGTGKYKVGAEIRSTTLRLDNSKGAAETLWTVATASPLPIPQVVETDSAGDFYAGGNGTGRNTLAKFDGVNGGVIWQHALVGSVTFLKFDKYNNVLYVFESGGRLVAFDTNGVELWRSASTYSQVVGIDCSATHIILGAANTVNVFNKTGQFITSFTIPALQHVAINSKNEVVTAAHDSNERVGKRTITGTLIWRGNGSLLATTYASRMVVDEVDRIAVAQQASSATSTAALEYLDGATGARVWILGAVILVAPNSFALAVDKAGTIYVGSGSGGSSPFYKVDTSGNVNYSKTFPADFIFPANRYLPITPNGFTFHIGSSNTIKKKDLNDYFKILS